MEETMTLGGGESDCDRNSTFADVDARESSEEEEDQRELLRRKKKERRSSKKSEKKSKSKSSKQQLLSREASSRKTSSPLETSIPRAAEWVRTTPVVAHQPFSALRQEAAGSRTTAAAASRKISHAKSRRSVLTVMNHADADDGAAAS